MSTVLILGSGPNVVESREWPRGPFDTIVAINNAWQVRDDWDVLIHPEDFPEDRRPADLSDGQRVVTADDYVAAQNRFGGFVYAGGTMAFTAGYWALDALKPRVLAFMGCDMVYPKGPQTHFYGKGAPDPLREDVTLRSLEAKSARLMILAARAGCAAVNLSGDESRLVFPRATPEALASGPPKLPDFTLSRVDAAKAAEAEAGYMVASGRYWEVEESFDPAVIDRIDAEWLRAAGAD
jgi:hypothetical protein